MDDSTQRVFVLRNADGADVFLEDGSNVRAFLAKMFPKASVSSVEYREMDDGVALDIQIKFPKGLVLRPSPLKGEEETQ